MDDRAPMEDYALHIAANDMLTIKDIAYPETDMTVLQCLPNSCNR